MELYKTKHNYEKDIDASTTCSATDNNCIYDLEPFVLSDYIEEFKKDGIALTNRINACLNKDKTCAINDLNKQLLKAIRLHPKQKEYLKYLQFYKVIKINDHNVHVFKQTSEKPYELDDFFILFNGRYAILCRECYRTGLDLIEMENILTTKYNIDCFN